MKNLSLIIFLIFSQYISANFVIGTFGPPIDRVRETATETEGTFNLKPYVGLFYRTQRNGPKTFSFELDYVFPQTSYSNMQEPLSKNRRLILQANMEYLMYQDFLYGIIGLSTVATKVYGDGTQVTVNGNQYYLPNEDGDSSYNTLLNFGVGLNFSQMYFGELKTHIWEVLNSQSRAISISLALKAQLF